MLSEAILNKDVWIWSASNIGPAIGRILVDNGVNIKGFIDNNKALEGTTVLNVKVWFPDDAFKIIDEKDLILLCTEKNNIPIRKQLSEAGITDNVVDWDAVILAEDNSVMVPLPDFMTCGYESRLVSKCCCREDFNKDWFKQINEEIKWSKIVHRKLWEFVYTVHILETEGLLKEGIEALGFAVGEEPLPSYFASKGVKVLATDLGMDGENADAWVKTGQNAGGNIEKIYNPLIIDRETFDRKVQYMDLDMNHIPDNLKQFDFCWSSCAIEHVGGLELSKQFLKNMIKVLKPGGIAVHTTEFNIWSNDMTEEEGYSVIYRRKDLEEIQKWMQENGCSMELSFKRPQDDADVYLPLPPYTQDDKRNHLNLIVGKYACTSYGLIIKKVK